MTGSLLQRLGGNVLNITVVNSPLDTYTSLEENNGTLQLCPCFTLELLSALQFALNFSYKLKATDTWGSLNESTGQWNGMIYDLLSGSADLALSPSAHLTDRLSVVDFNIAVYDEKLAALFLQPSLQLDDLALLKPFHYKLWYLILVWLGLFAIMLGIIETISVRRDANLATAFACAAYTIKHFQISVACIARFPPQKHNEETGVLAAASIRQIMWLSWSVVGVILLAAYEGTLIAFARAGNPGYSTFSELEKSSYRFDIENDSGIQQTVQECFPVVYAKREKYSFITGVANAKPRILKGSFAFITNSLAVYQSIGDDFSLTEVCSLGIISLPIESPGVATMLPKSSPYKRLVDQQIMNFKELGLNSRWITRWIPGRPRCDERYTDFEPIRLNSLTIAYAVYLMGLVLAVMTLIFEVKWKIQNSSRNFNRFKSKGIQECPAASRSNETIRRRYSLP